MGFDFTEAWREGDIIFIKKEYYLGSTDTINHWIKIYSDVNTKIYSIINLTNDNSWTCNCPAFKNNQECKHLKRLGLPDNYVKIKIVEE